MSDASAVIGFSAALIAGAAGSAHCLVMCGGLSAALGLRSRRTPAAALRDVWLYHCGRLAGYGLAGALFGLLGATMLSAVDLPLLATIARAGAGVLLISAALKVMFGWNLLSCIERIGAHYWKILQPLARRAMSGSDVTRSLTVGLLWGWLPCGLVYSMLVFSALSGDSLRGAGIMVAFGLGTMPAMLTSSAFAAKFGHWIRQRATRQLGGAVLLLFGLWIAGSAMLSGHQHDARGHSSSLHAPQPAATPATIGRPVRQTQPVLRSERRGRHSGRMGKMSVGSAPDVSRRFCVWSESTYVLDLSGSQSNDNESQQNMSHCATAPHIRPIEATPCEGGSVAERTRSTATC
jgi:sulfite exporter TauE/SafE